MLILTGEYLVRRYFIFLYLLGVVLLAGCNPVKSHLGKFNAAFQADCFTADNFERSAVFAESKISKKNSPKGADLMWTMQLGSIERLRLDHEKSNTYFDKSEEMLNQFDYQNQTLDSALAIASTENVLPYTGAEYDGIMVNTYKALNFMALGKEELARVEFNRALDRQRRAKEKYNREITKLREELDKGDEEENELSKKSTENPEVQTLISERYPNLYSYEAYPDFVNPFSTYIAGVFFNLTGDHTKAGPLLKEAYGMVSDSQYLAEDLAVMEKVLDGVEKMEGTVWLVFENGMGPVKEEFRIDLPIFIATDRIKYIGIALPTLEYRQEAYPYLDVRAEGQEYRTEIVADMDRVVQTEFNKDFGGILTRAIISTTAKAIAQYALEKQNSDAGTILSIGMAIYSAATTSADVRIWTTLPKNFQVARFDKPTDGKFTVAPPGGQSFEIEIGDCTNALVYVRIAFANSRPVYEVITY
ncbi:MAG: COG3014 family protein [Planctomycetota bacterium]|jgi:hypothetical protein